MRKIGDVAGPPVEVTTRTGEIVTLPETLARYWADVLALREEERLHYCDQHDIDPERFTGCSACEGTGYHNGTHLPCFCEQGERTQAWVDKKAAEALAEQYLHLDEKDRRR